MNIYQRVFLLALVAAVLSSAVSVVYAKHETRKLFEQWQSLQKVHDDLQVEWGRLQLEQATWATHGRVESIARTRLGMHMPQPGNVVVIER